ncbi:hypothetical protein CR157_01265 [Halomonas sp. LBP4]|nr:hypothetical protein CR157_01265 [Halomonas sp. LBP4]
MPGLGLAQAEEGRGHIGAGDADAQGGEQAAAVQAFAFVGSGIVTLRFHDTVSWLSNSVHDTRRARIVPVDDGTWPTLARYFLEACTFAQKKPTQAGRRLGGRTPLP